MGAVQEAIARGLSFGAPTRAEVRLAELVTQCVPSVEMVRMVNSGTEATMSAVRLARAATGRDLIIKFDGCYHGHADSLLVAAGSGVATLGIPGSPGIPKAVAAHTLSLPFNDAKAIEAAFVAKGDKIAAVIVEPVCGNMGVALPKKGFLETLRVLCDAHGALLIFDEVMTGFRLSLGGAQQVYGIRPDLTCLGKILGGGMPVGAYGGRRDLMEQIAPKGTVYQAGTLSGNPVAMAAGIATLEELCRNPDAFYGALEEKSARLEEGLAQAAEDAGLALCINRAGSMITLFFQAGPVTNFEQAKKSDTAAFGRFFNLMASQGVSLPPSQFEAWFVCAAHNSGQIEATVLAAAKAFKALA